MLLVPRCTYSSCSSPCLIPITYTTMPTRSCFWLGFRPVNMHTAVLLLLPRREQMRTQFIMPVLLPDGFKLRAACYTPPGFCLYHTHLCLRRFTFVPFCRCIVPRSDYADAFVPVATLCWTFLDAATTVPAVPPYYHHGTLHCRTALVPYLRHDCTVFQLPPGSQLRRRRIPLPCRGGTTVNACTLGSVFTCLPLPPFCATPPAHTCRTGATQLYRACRCGTFVPTGTCRRCPHLPHGLFD